MTILITGATGFIGLNLTKRLLRLGYNVTATGRNLKKLGRLSGKIEKLRLDLENPENIKDIFEKVKPNVVYHSAALVKSKNLSKLRRVNREGTKNILEACLKAGVGKVIHVSSIAVISGRDASAYGRSKIEAEDIALEYRKKGLKIAILRPGMVYGPGEPHALGLLVKLLKMRALPVFGGGSNRIPFVSVDNVVDVMVLCLSKEEAYEGTYVITDKETLTVKEALTYITHTLGVKPPFVINEKLTGFLKKLPLAGRYVFRLMKDRFYPIERLEKKFGYIPRVSVYDGLREAVLPYKKKT